MKEPKDKPERKPAESMTPPGGLKVLPNGEVVYEFEGKIIARGLDLTLSNKATPPDEDQIRWLRESDGFVGARVAAYEAAGLDSLLLSAYGETNAQVVIEAIREGELDALILKNGIIPTEEKLIAVLGEVLVTLMNAAQESSYPQLPELAKRIMAYGNVSSAGAKTSGEGFTAVKNGAGTYTVTFSSEMTIVPGVSVTPVTAAFTPHWAITELTKAKFKLAVVNTAGAATDSAFSFTAIG